MRNPLTDWPIKLEKSGVFYIERSRIKTIIAAHGLKHQRAIGDGLCDGAPLDPDLRQKRPYHSANNGP